MAASLWAGTVAMAWAQPPRPDRPNIVLIVTDDQGYGDVGCYGATHVRTPHLDRLAAQGTRFTSFYVSQPVCTASRASLLSGCYANRISLFGALNHVSHVGIAAGEKLLPEICQERGYATGIFGKWHLGHRPVFSPLRRGFDTFLGIPYSNDNGPLHPIVRGIPPLPWIDGNRVVETDPDQSQFTRRLTERAIQFVEAHRDQPFFLYLPHIMPHVPIFASEAFRGRSPAGLYGDVIEELDDGIGQLVATIDRLGLAERTLILFFFRQRSVPVVRQSCRQCRTFAGRQADDLRGGRARAVHRPLARPDSRRAGLRGNAVQFGPAADNRPPDRWQAGRAAHRW